MATSPKRNVKGKTNKPGKTTTKSQKKITRPRINLPTETSPSRTLAQSPQIPTINDLPFSYGETKLVLMVRDPYWAYSYWDFSGETWNWVQAKLGEDSALKPTIRVYDLTRHHSFDLLVSLEAKNWYLHLGIPDHQYVAELGLADGKSRFLLIARSNEVQTPRDSPSEIIDPQWPCKDMEELYRLWDRGSSWSSPASRFPLRKT